nr:unnamed protein product [Digitaria exilis]
MVGGRDGRGQRRGWLQIGGLHHRRASLDVAGAGGGGGGARGGSPPVGATPAPTRGGGWRPCCRSSWKSGGWTTSRRGGGCSCTAPAAGSAAALVHTRNVETKDYKFFSIGTVELPDGRVLHLIGMLGSWWIYRVSYVN